jgi:hypothetical protein
LQGAQLQKVDFQAWIWSNFVKKNVLQARGRSNFMGGESSATTGCANNDEPFRKLYLRELGDADCHTIDLNALRARLAKERSLNYLTDIASTSSV